MMFYSAFNSISVISPRQLTLFMLSWVSPVLGWGSEVSCPRTLPRKNPEDPVRLEPRTPGLQVKHFTTEPRRTPWVKEKMLVNPFPNKPWFLRVCSTSLLKTLWEKEKLLVTSNFSFSRCVFYPF